MSSDCFKIFDVNLVDQAAFTASSENLLFPLTNIKDQRRSKVYRSTSNSDTLILDFQETSEINGIFIMPSKRDGFGLSTVTVEFNATSNFSSPAYSVTVSLDETLGIGYASFSSVFYRFARIVMTSALGYCELGKVFMGKNLPLTAGINFGWTIKDDDLSIKTKNRYGQIFTDIIARQKVIGFAFKNINKDDLQLLNVMFDRIGESKIFYIVIGNSAMAYDYKRFSGPVILESVPMITNSSFNRFNLSISVREAM